MHTYTTDQFSRIGFREAFFYSTLHSILSVLCLLFLINYLENNSIWMSLSFGIKIFPVLLKLKPDKST